MSDPSTSAPEAQHDATELTWRNRYSRSLMGVFGTPQLCLVDGHGCVVVDESGKEYLDLLGGIAVNALGHAHPAWVAALEEQAERVAHVSNFFTTPQQVRLAETLLRLAEAPEGSTVFLSNSGTEANEAAIKICLAHRPNGRIIALEHAFHGRTIGALSLTHKVAYRAPFGRSGVTTTFVPPEDVDALSAEVDAGDVAGVFVEPVQGEAGVVPLSANYLRAVRQLTEDHGVLMVTDEVQCGMGRTGRWFAHRAAGIVPDVVTMAKALGGGFPIGATIALGGEVSSILSPGQHGTTFGGNPLACAVAQAVIDTVESENLLENVRTLGAEMAEALSTCHPMVREVRGSGLLLGIQLDQEVAPQVVAAALEAGFIINAANPSTLRLAPPYILTREQAMGFVAALPGLLDSVRR